MRGYRTRPVAYPKGAATASGKQTAYLHGSKELGRPHLLVVSDSNARNYTYPKIVSPSRSSPFSLSSICLPGGQFRHGVKEISETDPFANVDYVLLALGTNDIARFNGWSKDSRVYAEQLIRVTQQAYPGAKIILSQILPQQNCCVAEANKDMERITKSFGVRLVDLDVGRIPRLWSDGLHLSDRGLHRYMEILESVMSKIVVEGNCIIFTLKIPNYIA
ncbi:uncharacterized protein LOC144423018 [Styela clava]